MNRIKITLRSYDYILILAVIAVGVFGVLMVYSFGNATSTPFGISSWAPSLWRRQIIYIVSGTVIMVAISFIDYRIITRFFVYIYILMIMLLIVAMITGVDDGTGVARWIWIPVPIPGVDRLSLQPSEFSKLFMTLFLAKFLDVKKDTFNKIWWLGLLLILILVPVILVERQPSLSASLVVLTISLIVLFVGGLYYRTIIIGLGLVAPIFAFIWLDLRREVPAFLPRVLNTFQWERIETWLDPQMGSDAFRQTQQSLAAISAGGLTGRGFMNVSYVANGHNDFVFSLVAEQFGFVGATVLLGAVVLIIARCILIALRAQDIQGRLIATGVAGMIIFETFVHVSVATNFLPNTGMPFPFVSFGGSMIWVHMLAIGVVLNVKIPREKSIFDDEDDR